MIVTKEEIKKRLAAIPSVDPDEIDLQLMAEAKDDIDLSTISLEEMKQKREYSGKILLRIPKELHLHLAKIAKREGVSLNQYCLYKLSKGIEASQ